MRLVLISMVMLVAEAAPAAAPPDQDEPAAPVAAPATAPTTRAPRTAPAPAASRPRAAPHAAPAPRELRFDALRVDGALRGPEVLEVEALARGARRSLLRLHRSFLGRIFETLESPGLHGR